MGQKTVTWFLFANDQGMDDVQVRGAATDIFSYLVEYNPSMVREFVMQESQQNDDVSDTHTMPLIKPLPHCPRHIKQFYGSRH